MNPCVLQLLFAAVSSIVVLPTESPESVLRGEKYWVGRFDVDGNFIRNPEHPPYSEMPARLAGSCTFGGNVAVYEHRSGCLIQGVMAERPFGVFVPELGSTVLDLKKDFNVQKPARIVWNMPQYRAAYTAERQRKYGDKPWPSGSVPPPTGFPVGWEFTPFSKLDTDFVGRKLPTAKRLTHVRAIGDVVEFGHLSDEGEFIPDPDLPVLSRSGILGPIKFDRFSTPRYYTVPQDSGKKEKSEEVYEYRSGRLIKGTLQASGNFVPELGSKILDFKDYDPEQLPHRRIYNLPGVLRPIEKK